MGTEAPSKGRVKEKGKKKERKGGRAFNRISMFEIFFNRANNI